MRKILSSAVLAATGLLFTTPAAAQSSLEGFDPEAIVELEAKDGSTTLVGELTGVEDGFYLLRTEIGELRISIDAAICSGERCPAQSESIGFAIHVEEGMDLALVTSLLRDYALKNGAEIQALDSGDPDRRAIRLIDTETGNQTEISFYSGRSGLIAMANGEAELVFSNATIGRNLDTVFSGPAVEQVKLPENERIIARDAISIVVNRNNRVRNLTADEIARIFRGEITNWLELGGGDVAISPYITDPSQVRGDIVKAKLIGESGRFTGRARVVTNDDTVVNSVQADRGGIGIVSSAMVDGVAPITIREACGLLTPPTNFKVKMGAYPLSYPLYLYRLPSRMHPVAEDFFAWATGATAQETIRNAGFIDRDPEFMRLEEMGMMLIHTAAVEPDFSPTQYAEMLRELRDAARLSLAFRFRSGSSTLDDQSRENLQELARRMEAEEFAGLELLIVGFADAIGNAAENTQLAANRALTVRRILSRTVSAETTSRLRLRTLSFGELMPMACNDGETGRAQNRRVEIWVRRPGVLSVGR